MVLELLTFFLFFSIDNVLYVFVSSFKLLSISRLTCSLYCVISFIRTSSCSQEWSSRHVIGTRCESHGRILVFNFLLLLLMIIPDVLGYF